MHNSLMFSPLFTTQVQICFPEETAHFHTKTCSFWSLNHRHNHPLTTKYYGERVALSYFDQEFVLDGTRIFQRKSPRTYLIPRYSSLSCFPVLAILNMQQALFVMTLILCEDVTTCMVQLLREQLVTELWNARVGRRLKEYI